MKFTLTYPKNLTLGLFYDILFILKKYPSLAHLDRVPDSDSVGGGFESRRMDQKRSTP